VVRIRMKSFGRRHRPFFRICAMDSRTGRDGRAIEELGHYDPMVRNLEARTVLDASRVRYWLSVGAQPSEKVQAILNRLGVTKPAAGEPWKLPDPPAGAPPAPGTAAAAAAATKIPALVAKAGARAPAAAAAAPTPEAPAPAAEAEAPAAPTAPPQS